MNKKNSITIVVMMSVLFVGILFYVEQVLQVPYILKTMVKIPMFIGFPFIVKRFILKEKISFYMSGKNLKVVLVWSFLVASVIMIAFMIVKSFIDTTLIASDLEGRMELTKMMFISVAVYTIIGNSFIEEYFFRGFIFQSLYNKGLFKLSYIISALLFAIYHVGIFMSWFSFPIMCLVLVGLFVGGLIFSYFVSKTNSVLASYLIHMTADFTIILIGVFGMGLFA
jgi:membrane protease YdiL (CAAX protease family)